MVMETSFCRLFPEMLCVDGFEPGADGSWLSGASAADGLDKIPG
jgi:hypothetical protein